jgi:hypothetical protein
MKGGSLVDLISNFSAGEWLVVAICVPAIISILIAAAIEMENK